MIRVIKRGMYLLTETKNNIKILTLDNDHTYFWLQAKGIGEIVGITTKSHDTKSILSAGNYRLYKVADEPEFSDQVHLELSIGQGNWQGYLLPNGLPTNTENRHRIIPTHEVISSTTEESVAAEVPYYE